MKIWFKQYWFVFIIAICTILTTLFNILIGLLNLGWLEFVWRWHNNLGW